LHCIYFELLESCFESFKVYVGTGFCMVSLHIIECKGKF
jgi:hypothetical protein